MAIRYGLEFIDMELPHVIRVGDKFTLRHFDNLLVIVSQVYQDSYGETQIVIIRDDNGLDFGRFTLREMRRYANFVS